MSKEESLQDLWNAQNVFIDQVTQMTPYNPMFRPSDFVARFLFGTIDVVKFDPK